MPNVGEWALAPETPWPNIAGPRVRVRVPRGHDEKVDSVKGDRYLFGVLIAGSDKATPTVLTDGHKVIQARKEDVQ